jgi:hypothetical protein
MQMKRLGMKFFWSVFLLVTVSGCGQTKTQEYYMSHQEEMAADLAECKQLGKSTYNCNEADKAVVFLKKKN